MAITIVNAFDLDVQEQAGRPASLVRRLVVSGITSTDPVSYAHDILSSSSVPKGGTAIAVNGSFLYLEDRTVKASRDSALGEARVDLTYRRREVSSQSGATPTLRIQSSLKQVQTNKVPGSDPAQLLEVSYTWPADSKRVFPDGRTKDGETEVQGGSLTYVIPTLTLTGQIVAQAASPGATAKAYIGKVNSQAWQGGDARTWMCTSCSADLIDVTTSPWTWRFDFTFEFDPNTWDDETTVVFIDPDTGRPPADLVDGDGIKKYQIYDTKNFGDDF